MNTSTSGPTPASPSADATLSRGSALHAAGSLHQALDLFEACLVREPEHAGLLIARSAVLLDLGLPETAWRSISAHAHTLERLPGQAANVAIVAEGAGDFVRARAAYEQALSTQPDDLRALNNLALLDARERHWPQAIARARECVARAPAEVLHAFTLADILIHADRPGEAIHHLTGMQQQFGAGPGITLRMAMALALQGDLAGAHALLKPLGDAGRQAVRDFIRYSHAGPQAPAEDLTGLFLQRAEARLDACDWQAATTLEAGLASLAATLSHSAAHDCRSAMRTGRSLGWPEARWQPFRAANTRFMLQIAQRIAPPVIASPWKPGDDRIRIGLLLPELAAHPECLSLCDLMHRLDPARFKVRAYGPRLPAADDTAWLSRIDRLAAFTELGFMTQGEMIGRLRLDRLDVLVDATAMTPWSLDAVLHARAASVQVQAPGSWLAQAVPYDFVFADDITHPRAASTAGHQADEGRLVRLPAACWLPPSDALTASFPAASRQAAGLPEDALVLCAHAPSAHIDSRSFALWMDLLNAHRRAVLWLPGCGEAHGDGARAQLLRSAAERGVGEARLVFSAPPPHDALQHHLALADLYLDTTRISSAYGLSHALVAGTPAVTLMGETMDSRLGARLLHAAGLDGLIAGDGKSYVALAGALLDDPAHRQALRRQLQARATDGAASFRLWEHALTRIAEAARGAAPAASFEVQPG